MASLDVLIRLRAEVTEAQKKLKNLQKAFTSGMNMSKHTMKRYDAALENVEKAKNRLRMTMEKGKREFPSWALSLMFFGMMLERTFSRIWMHGRQTFQDVMHSVEGTVTGFDILEGSLKYLGFVVGQALEPIARLLAPWIDKLSRIIMNNEELFRTVVAVGFIIGTTFAAGGAAIMSISALKTAFLAAKGAAIALKAYNWVSLGNAIKAGIGLVYVGFALKATSDIIANLKQGQYWDAMLSAAQLGIVAWGAGRLIAGKKGHPYFIAALIALEAVKEPTLFKSIVQIMSVVAATIVTFVRYIGHIIEHGIAKSIHMGFYKALDYVLNTLGRGVLDFLGLGGLGDAVKGLARMSHLYQKPQPFDWVGTYKTAYRGGVEGGMKFYDMIRAPGLWMDKMLEDDEPFSIPEGPSSSMYGGGYSVAQRPLIINIDGNAVYQSVLKETNRIG